MDLATLQHSVFLYALGSAILNSLLQAFILWFIYETINVFYKTATSGFKNKLSTLLMFTAFIWFIVTFISKVSFDEKEISSVSSAIATAIPLKQTTTNGFTMQNILSNAAGILPYLSISYIFLLLFLMIKLFTAYRYVYFIANKRLIVPPLRLLDFASKVAVKMNIAKNIKVWLSDHVDVPATIGFLKPVILIPVASVNNLSSDQLEAIILHELSHIKRNDYLMNLFISVIETILFFNPFILLLARAVKTERENCCDDFVIHYRYDPHSYASALLCLEQSRRSNLQLSVAAVSGKKQLLTRIKRITNNKEATSQFNYGQKLFALLMITGIIVCIGWLFPQEKTKHGIKEEAKTLEKNISITKVSQDKKTEVTELPNFQGVVKLHQAPQAKDSNSSIDMFKNDDPKPADNDVAAFEWNDFEKNTLKLAKQALQSSRLFHIQKAKFAPFEAIPNFKFPKLTVNIDVADLNKNLKQAYQAINALDWNQIQSDIHEALSNKDIQHANEAEKKALLQEKAKSMQLMRIQNKRMNRAKEILPLPGKDFFVSDSSQLSAATQINKDILPRQKKYYPEVRTQTNGNGNIHGSGNYNYVSVPKAGVSVENTLKHNSHIPKAITFAGLNNKNIKLIIENIKEALKKNNASFNFSSSFSSESKKYSKENKQKVVSLEINDLP